MEDVTFPDRTMLKTGTKVIYAIYVMGRMVILGNDCKEIMLERWIREGNFQSEFAYRIFAFNEGTRMYLGTHLAYHPLNKKRHFQMCLNLTKNLTLARSKENLTNYKL